MASINCCPNCNDYIQFGSSSRVVGVAGCPLLLVRGSCSKSSRKHAGAKVTRVSRVDDIIAYGALASPLVDLEGWKERLSVERDTPTTATPMVDHDTSGDSDSEGEEPVAMEATTSNGQQSNHSAVSFRVSFSFVQLTAPLWSEMIRGKAC